MVDDLPAARMAVRGLLRRCRFAVDVAAGPSEALELLRSPPLAEGAYDVIVVDHEMPGTDGLELARELRELPGARDAAVLVMSASLQRIDTGRLAEYGVTAFMQKPVRAQSLYDRLSELAFASQATVMPAVSAAAGETRRVLPAFRDLKILAAEDGPTNRLVLAGMLKSEGVELHFATDGKAAVEQFLALSPDLVLMDLWMPELDGFQATARIRALEKEHGSTRTPIVALTANAMRGDREKCLAADMDDYLSKPIRKKILLAMIERWRGAKSAGDRLAEPLYEGGDRRDPGKVDGSLEFRLASDVVLTDESRIEAMVAELGPEEFGVLVGQFCSDVEKGIEGLADLARQGDGEELRTVLHMIRGCSSNLGIGRLVQICDRIRVDLQKGRACPAAEVDECVRVYREARADLLSRAARAPSVCITATNAYGS